MQNIIKNIKSFPLKLKETVIGLTLEDLTLHKDKRSWSISQIVHHIADAQMNKFAQIRSTLSEDASALDHYVESEWVNLPGGNSHKIANSLMIIEGLYNRVEDLLSNINEHDWLKAKPYGSRGDISVKEMVDRFVAHGDEHLEEIRRLKG